MLVHTNDGLTGIGRGGNAQPISRELAPVLIGQGPRRIALLWERVWRLLGGYRDTVPAYADGIGHLDQSPEEVAAEVKEHAGLGFDAIKLHFNRGEPQEVLDKVHGSREVLGPDKKLMIDVSRAWSGKVAVETVQRLEPYNLYWIEEPVRHDDEPFYMRMVQEATSAMVAGAEGEGTFYGVRGLINEGALQLGSVDISREPYKSGDKAEKSKITDS